MDTALNQINARLEMLCGSIKKLDEIDITVKALDSKVEHLIKENDTLKQEIAKRGVKIQQLSDHVNRLDQASRSASLRILGLPVSNQTPPGELYEIVYREILVPILEAAKKSGDIAAQADLPPHYLIVNAFTIPAKRASTSNPVILKLNSEFIRSLVFKHKKSALPTVPDISSNKVRNKFSIFEDLSPATHAQFRSFAEDARVKSVWSYSGQVRFKTHESETVFKAKSLSDSFETIVKSIDQPVN
jgi:HPt (histidine-containing phosphotransfer) domain-containing protein